MLLRLIYDEKLAQAAYLIGCQRTGEALVIDPQRDVDRYIDLARREGLRITAVAETHIHADYLSGARELAQRTGAAVYVSGMGGPDWSYRWLDNKPGGGSYPNTVLRDGDSFRIGNIELKALHTPGHTPEHLAFLVTDRGGGATEPMGIATGDFVFVGDLGRPDLLESAAGHAGAAAASAKALFQSARQFLDLPDYLQVWPAHGAGSACGKALGAVPQSTVGYEKRFNLSLRAARDDESAFAAAILEGQPEPPLYFARMKRENRDGPALLGELPRPRQLAAADLSSIDGTKTAILDTRTWPAFRAAHLPGALSAPLDKSFPTIAGSYVEPGTPIVLIVEDSRVDEAVRDLVRVGLDSITAFATPAALDEYVRSGGRKARTPEIDAAAAKTAIDAQRPFVLDVRKSGEFAAGHIPGATNMVHIRLPENLAKLPKDRPILVHCQGGVRSARAAALLERAGFSVTNMAGGFGAWQKSGGAVTR